MKQPNELIKLHQKAIEYLGEIKLYTDAIIVTRQTQSDLDKIFPDVKGTEGNKLIEVNRTKIHNLKKNYGKVLLELQLDSSVNK